MDDLNVPNRVQYLVSAEHGLKNAIKVEQDQEISSALDLDLVDEIKTEILEIEESEALDLGEPDVDLTPETITKCNSIINLDKKKFYTCAICSYRTEHRYNLIRHVKSHGQQTAPNLSYKCKHCPFECVALQQHALEHSNTYIKCPQCEFTTQYKESLTKHQLKHKPTNQCQMFACDECEYESKQKLLLKKHTLIHKRLEEVEHFKCPHCTFVTKHQPSINNHILKIHKKDKLAKYGCTECDFGTYHKISLKGHILTHRKPGEVPMFKCPECPYETKNKAFLPNHMKKHKETVPCPKCQKLITPRGMPLHLKSHESSDVKNKYKCTHCPYATLYYGNMSRHLKIMHSNKKDIEYKQCADCTFKTFENARLKRHIKEIHSSEAPEFKCPECDFNSKFNSCLKRHVETAHGDKKPETCPVCFKASANIYTLRIHMKLHRKEDEIKMFRCGDCSYKTRHSGAYKEHILRHKSPNEVPVYQCTNCSFQTKSKPYLADHIARYSGNIDSKYKICCPCCCFKTSSKNSLRIHMSKVHRNEMDQSEFWHCSLCGFKTLNKRVLIRHMKEHRYDECLDESRSDNDAEKINEIILDLKDEDSGSGSNLKDYAIS